MDTSANLAVKWWDTDAFMHEHKKDIFCMVLVVAVSQPHLSSVNTTSTQEDTNRDKKHGKRRKRRS